MDTGSVKAQKETLAHFYVPFVHFSDVLRWLFSVIPKSRRTLTAISMVNIHCAHLYFNSNCHQIILIDPYTSLFPLAFQFSISIIAAAGFGRNRLETTYQ
jgi:hypothetical protein